MSRIASMEQLEAIYGKPMETSLVKEVDRLTPEYRRLIEASPFAALATCGPEGLDCSPRGDLPGFVRVADDKTLLMPDRRGNNRVDTLRNIVRDPRVALLFLIPGSGTTLARQRPRPRSVATRAAGQLSRWKASAPRSVVGDRRSTASISSAPAPSCAPTCGTRRSTSIPNPCRRRERSSLAQRPAHRRRGLRPRMAGARPQIAVVDG